MALTQALGTVDAEAAPAVRAGGVPPDVANSARVLIEDAYDPALASTLGGDFSIEKLKKNG
jgi:hypothetical protein